MVKVEAVHATPTLVMFEETLEPLPFETLQTCPVGWVAIVTL